MTFTESLSARSRSAETLLCVGLDPDISRFPEHIKNGPDPVGTFCRAVIDATAQYACAFKPQIAYFAALRAESVLEALIDYIHTNHPGIPVIWTRNGATSGQPPNSTPGKRLSATRPMP